jgi:hypothetical protein
MTPNQETPKSDADPIFSQENMKSREGDMPPVVNTQGIPVRQSHSYYKGMFDHTTNSFARKERFINRTYAGKSQIDGYGVFAKEDIKAGEIIEECQAVLLDTTFPKNKDWVLGRYCMTWIANSEIDRVHGPTMSMMLGHGMIYNHSETPNSYVVQDTFMKVFTFYALTDIPKGTEITWYYGLGYAERLRNEGHITHSKFFPDGAHILNSPDSNSLAKMLSAPAKTTTVTRTNSNTPEPDVKKKGGCGCGAKKVAPPPSDTIESPETTPKEKPTFRSMVVPDKIISEDNTANTLENNNTVTNDQVSESKV